MVDFVEMKSAARAAEIERQKARLPSQNEVERERAWSEIERLWQIGKFEREQALRSIEVLRCRHRAGEDIGWHLVQFGIDWGKDSQPFLAASKPGRAPRVAQDSKSYVPTNAEVVAESQKAEYRKPDGTLKRGAKTRLAKRFSVNASTITHKLR